jgi:hypothetical protein
MFNKSKASVFIRENFLDLMLCIFIALIGIFYTEQISLFIDIGLYDESSYLKYGLDFFEKIPPAEAAPLYAFWYKILSFINPDTVSLYYLNYRLMTIMPAIGLFVFFRVGGLHQFYALVASVWLLCMPGNFFIWPKVSHFALLVFFIGAAIAISQKDLLQKISIFFITFLLIAYIRPEYFISAVILFLLLLFVLLKNILAKKLPPSLASAFLVPSIFFVVCLFGLGNPMSSGDRSMLAFGQHFSLNQERVSQRSQNPWTNWENTVKTSFGDAQGVTSSFLANPSAFLWHATENLKNIPNNVAATFLQTLPRSERGNIKYSQVFIAAAGLALLFVSYGLYLRRLKNANNGRNFFRDGFIKSTEFLLLFIFLVPSAIAILIIYPRQHHIFLAGWIALSYVVVHFVSAKPKYLVERKEILFLLLALVLLTLRQIPAQSELDRQPNLMTIRYLQQLNANEKVNILEAEGGFHIYLGPNFKRVAEYEKSRSWNIFLKDREVNMIVVTESLMSDSRFQGDKEWLNFLKNPTAHGFSEIQVPYLPSRKILYKNDLHVIPLQ